jgi:endo-1,4-beta-xylanase
MNPYLQAVLGLWLVGVAAAQGQGTVPSPSPATNAPSAAAAAAVAPTTPAPALPLPSPLGIPAPGPSNDAPYAPQPILPGGVVIPLYPPGSPFLKAERVREAEVYNLSRSVPGRISSIVNIHNPSIEFHPVDPGINTGSVILLAAGGGHNTLNVGTESADFVSYFYNFGINTVILRNRLRRDGYEPKVDAVNDAFQAIRLVRAHAREWNLDPNRIGIMGFSAGAELSAPTAIFFENFTRTNSAPGDPLAGISARPDFVGIVYPGPSPFARGGNPPVPKNTPPAFLTCPGAGDRVHAIWATEYFTAMLQAGIPNVEMHIYGNGRHPGDPLPDGSRMSGGLTHRDGIPFGTWQDRFIDWFRDLGFLQKPGLETRAARDVRAFSAASSR